MCCIPWLTLFCFVPAAAVDLALLLLVLIFAPSLPSAHAQEYVLKSPLNGGAIYSWDDISTWTVSVRVAAAAAQNAPRAGRFVYFATKFLKTHPFITLYNFSPSVPSRYSALGALPSLPQRDLHSRHLLQWANIHPTAHPINHNELYSIGWYEIRINPKI